MLNNNPREKEGRREEEGWILKMSHDIVREGN